MTTQEHARKLLDEWELCQQAKSKKNAVDIQLDKDVLAPWAVHLARHLEWYDSENTLQKACYQFESRLNALKEKIVIEVLKNGAV